MKARLSKAFSISLLLAELIQIGEFFEPRIGIKHSMVGLELLVFIKEIPVAGSEWTGIFPHPNLWVQRTIFAVVGHLG